MRLSTVILAALFCCSCASAATIYIDSQQGLFTSFDGLATVAITPHPLWEGNHPVNPGDPPTLDELREHGARGLARYKLPDRIRIIDQMPLNATHKLDRRTLAAIEQQS